MFTMVVVWNNIVKILCASGRDNFCVFMKEHNFESKFLCLPFKFSYLDLHISNTTL
jgi:hypothetical protein